MTELWMSHGKLVAAIAAKYRRSDIDHDDLINAGHLGLHTAIMRFDATRYDSRLSAYASVWIRWHIHDYIRRNSGPVRLPESKAHRQLAQSSPRLLSEARKACEREGVDPTDSELHLRIGSRIGLSSDEVATGLRLIQDGRASLNAQDGEEGYESSLRDEAAPTADDINERMDHARLRLRLRALANEILGERERAIFLTRTMADSHDIPSLEKFAEQFGVSIARIHQIETSARRKIAAALAVSGYAEVTGENVVADISQVRARRGPGSAGRVRDETAARAFGREADETFILRAADE
ncbi:MAG: sigma-70 family RNA polymerase sigma factor [Acetobacteraceae bacterium]|nr:sigma-70 family RNA polymerase sigma factor [Acetobacteraceae bacterium]